MHPKPVVIAIDDDPAILDALRYIVRDLNLDYEPHLSAESFWRTFDPAKVGCIILDMGMPDQTGEELFDQLAAMGKSWPTIAITGHGELALGVRMAKKGVLDFLEKPFSADGIKSLILQAIEQDRKQKSKHLQESEMRELVDSLNEGQKAVLHEILRGSTSREIAQQLDISLRTVQIRRTEIAKILNIAGRSGWTKLIFDLRQLYEGET